MKPKAPHVVVLVTAIVGIIILETVALLKGIDGAKFALAVVAVAGIAGYKIKDILALLQRK